MKLSLLLAALILVAASFFGWQGHSRLSTAREENVRLATEAAELGVDTSNLATDGSKATIAKLRRDKQADKEAVAKDYAAKLIAFAHEMEDMQKQGQQPDEAMQKRIMDLIGGLLDLDGSQLKLLVVELREAPGLSADTRSGMIGFTVMMLANDHPATALNLLAESSDILKESGMSRHVVASALQKWAQSDPKAAIEWTRKNAKDHPEMVTDETKKGILAGAAKIDPALAFTLMSELDLKDANSLGNSIAESASTPEQRTAVMAALRNHLKTLDDKERLATLNNTMSSLSGKAAQDGFTAGAAWVESAKLSEEEREGFANGMNYWQTKGDTGKWIEWMDGKLPAEKLDGKIQSMMTQWTENDYKAAGQWLNDSKDGAMKNSAIRSYAGAVAPYEPATAAEWALTLPESPERKELLDNIHRQWKGKDAAAAAKFAQQNGLTE